MKASAWLDDQRDDVNFWRYVPTAVEMLLQEEKSLAPTLTVDELMWYRASIVHQLERDKAFADIAGQQANRDQWLQEKRWVEARIVLLDEALNDHA